ncbi:MAG: universal stress protein [Acidimicrobiales bacterium]
MSSFERILVGWDGSGDARRAFRTAVDLAEETGAEVVVLAVLNRSSHGDATNEVTEEMADRRRESVAEMTAEARNDGFPASVRVRYQVIEAEHTASTLEAYVREHGFDLVVVGRHGIDRAMHPNIGGVTEHQVRHCPCPVIVVPAEPSPV